jgi:hypothetical protein
MIISLQIYCTCGSYVRGAATPQEADQLMQAFAALHAGDGHAPCHACNAFQFGDPWIDRSSEGPGIGNSMN